MKSLLFALLLLPAIAGAEDVNLTAVLSAIRPGTVTVIGEHHQHAESPAFFQHLVDDALEHNRCITVALEIYSNQQAVLDQIQAGKATANDLVISSIIDHQKYREMIAILAAEAQRGACLRLLAIDAGDDVDMNRDKWMAQGLDKQSKDTPILVLLGNMHALQRVRWNHSRGMPSVSEILAASGRKVKTYLQHWPEPCSAQRSAYFYTSGQSAALPALHRLFSVMNAETPTSAAGVIDGVIVWECGKGALRG